MPKDPNLANNLAVPARSTVETRRRSAEERLRLLAERRDRLAREMAALEARARTEARRRDNRRRFMLGGFLLWELARNPQLRTQIAARLNLWLTRPGDRELFADLLASAARVPGGISGVEQENVS